MATSFSGVPGSIGYKRNFSFYSVFTETDKVRAKGGGREKVSELPKTELKSEEIEVSLTLGGGGEGRVQGRRKWRGCDDT